MEEINLVDVITKELVIIDHEPFESKEEMFDILTKEFEKAGAVSSAFEYKKSLEFRETEGSTYIGEFMAIPHGKCKEVLRPAVAFCRCKDAFEYISNDEKGPVKYIFMMAIVNNDTSNKHLRVLASIASLLMHDDFKEALETVKDYNELIKAIEKSQQEE